MRVEPKNQATEIYKVKMDLFFDSELNCYTTTEWFLQYIVTQLLEKKHENN